MGAPDTQLLRFLLASRELIGAGTCEVGGETICVGTAVRKERRDGFDIARVQFTIEELGESGGDIRAMDARALGIEQPNQRGHQNRKSWSVPEP